MDENQNQNNQNAPAGMPPFTPTGDDTSVPPHVNDGNVAPAPDLSATAMPEPQTETVRTTEPQSVASTMPASPMGQDTNMPPATPPQPQSTMLEPNTPMPSGTTMPPGTPMATNPSPMPDASMPPSPVGMDNGAAQMGANDNPPQKGGSKKLLIIGGIVAVVALVLLVLVLVLSSLGQSSEEPIPTQAPNENLTQPFPTDSPVVELTTDVVSWIEQDSTLGFTVMHPPEMNANVNSAREILELEFSATAGDVLADGFLVYLSSGELAGRTISTVAAEISEEVSVEGLEVGEPEAFTLGTVSGYRFTATIEQSGEEIVYMFMPLGDTGYVQAQVSYSDPLDKGYADVIDQMLLSLEEGEVVAETATPSAEPSL